MAARGAKPNVAPASQHVPKLDWEVLKRLWVLDLPPRCRKEARREDGKRDTAAWLAILARALWGRLGRRPTVTLPAAATVTGLAALYAGSQPIAAVGLASALVLGAVELYHEHNQLSTRHHWNAKAREQHRLKRMFQLAALHCGLQPLPAFLDGGVRDVPPYLAGVKDEDVPAELRGYMTTLVVMPVKGTDRKRFDAAMRERMLSTLKVPVTWEWRRDATVRIEIHHKDLVDYDPIYDPSESAYDGIRLGVDHRGEFVYLPVFEENSLMGGRPRSGKSTTGAVLLCELLLAPFVEPWIIDPQSGVSSLAFKDLIPNFATNPDDALELLRVFHGLMEKRETDMAEAGTSLATPSARWPLRVLYIDETLKLVDEELRGKDYATEFRALLLDILNGGPKTGHSIIATATNPRADLLTKGMRSTFHATIAYKVRSSTDSGVLLGAGNVEPGYEPNRLPDGQPGRAVFMHLGYHHVRTFRLETQDQVEAAVAKVRAIREASDILTPLPAYMGESQVLPELTSEGEEQPSGRDVTAKRATVSPAERRRAMIKAWSEAPYRTATVAEVAAELDIPVPTVHRYVHSLPLKKVRGGYQLLEAS